MSATREKLVAEAVRKGWHDRPRTGLGAMFEAMADDGRLLVLDDRGPGSAPIDDRTRPARQEEA